MNISMVQNNPYLLLTPGPLSTSRTVKEAMLRDWCTWDEEYNVRIVQQIRKTLVAMATSEENDYTSVLMQGSGTFSVEAAIGTIVSSDGVLLILVNGAYGKRIVQIAEILKITHMVYDVTESETFDVETLTNMLVVFPEITHVAFVHCETTTGILNPLKEIARCVSDANRSLIVDAMSSFGGIPIDMHEMKIDVLVSSANKCIQGVPGFGFVVLRKSIIEKCEGISRSLSLDLYEQWKTMEENNGKWRFTSPTHVVRAFSQALTELDIEGGIHKRFERYTLNQSILVKGMRNMGFETLLPDSLHSPIITSFKYPKSKNFDFKEFYNGLKKQGFLIYPGKISKMETFRIGNIGEVYPKEIYSLLGAIEKTMVKLVS